MLQKVGLASFFVLLYLFFFQKNKFDSQAVYHPTGSCLPNSNRTFYDFDPCMLQKVGLASFFVLLYLFFF
ncbi:hypothetical protein RV00_GL002027 [Enterococcus devriesei]|uniref:Uncharacterized protein n=1 Tax=Enterococcus devriesei TaxID=319970 RepID=A0A1L8SVB8_9ENTE|nr:hypothetical protein RV00_GL002027 [Enterococcus devriesei]